MRRVDLLTDQEIWSTHFIRYLVSRVCPFLAMNHWRGSIPFFVCQSILYAVCLEIIIGYPSSDLTKAYLILIKIKGIFLYKNIFLLFATQVCSRSIKNKDKVV